MVVSMEPGELRAGDADAHQQRLGVAQVVGITVIEGQGDRSLGQTVVFSCLEEGIEAHHVRVPFQDLEMFAKVCGRPIVAFHSSDDHACGRLWRAGELAPEHEAALLDEREIDRVIDMSHRIAVAEPHFNRMSKREAGHSSTIPDLPPCQPPRLLSRPSPRRKRACWRRTSRTSIARSLR